jgi:hypothetical protein
MLPAVVKGVSRIAPRNLFVQAYSTQFKYVTTGYGEVVDGIVNSVETKAHQDILLDVVNAYKQHEERYVNPAAELAPYLRYFPDEPDPTNPTSKPKVVRQELPRYPTYEEYRNVKPEQTK